MGRGKIEIKKIENSTNRQVTFAKRRAGLIKKAQELTVLCDAEILLILLSASGNRGFHYCSPSTNIKEMIDRFQEAANVDLWSEPYEKMQKELEDLLKTNSNLRKQIRQRMGEELDGLDSDELRALAEDLEFTARVVREEKYNELRTKTNTKTKKVKKFESELEGTLFYSRSGPKETQELGYVFDQEELFRTAAAAAAATTVGYGNEAAAVGTFGDGRAEEVGITVDSEQYYRPTSAFSFTGYGEELAYSRPQASQSKHEVEYAGLHELRLA